MSKHQKKTRKQAMLEFVEAIVTALILALIIKAYVIQAFKIPSGSMIPTLLIGDHVLVNKFIYGTDIPFTDKRILVFKKPEKHDIIVFKAPNDPKRDFIKRVIGVGGDVIEGKEKALYVNGIRQEEGFIRHSDSNINEAGPRDSFGPVRVPLGKYFVMGDNRDESSDSRFWGFVDEEKILGRAMFIYWSWDSTNFRPRLDRITDRVR